MVINMEWVDSLWKRKIKKPVFKEFFYYDRTTPVEHRRMKKQKVIR